MRGLGTTTKTFSIDISLLEKVLDFQETEQMDHMSAAFCRLIRLGLAYMKYLKEETHAQNSKPKMEETPKTPVP